MSNVPFRSTGGSLTAVHPKGRSAAYFRKLENDVLWQKHTDSRRDRGTVTGSLTVITGSGGAGLMHSMVWYVSGPRFYIHQNRPAIFWLRTLPLYCMRIIIFFLN